VIASLSAMLETWHNFRAIYRMQRHIYGRFESIRIAYRVAVKSPPF